MPKERITYTYDGQWRRAGKKVEVWNGGTNTWVIQTHMRYAYEGWNLIAEWDMTVSPPKLVRTHHWGVDLSGTREGAGGVGGLVMTRLHALPGQDGVKATMPAYDGTGNIIAYLDTADGKVVAENEYGPFGEPLRQTGPLASELPHRWSSKFTDDETGLSYYGYRYYSAVAGRWLSRDPIEERGGLGLYGFVYNNANAWVDRLGREPVDLSGGSHIPGVYHSLEEFPNKEEGAADFTKIKDEINRRLQNINCPCTDKDRIRDAAKELSEKLIDVWQREYNEVMDRPGDERAGGHFCYDWAKAFKTIVDEAYTDLNVAQAGMCKPEYRQFFKFTEQQQRILQNGGIVDAPKTHWAVKICFGDCSRPECCINLDDGFLGEGCTHDGDWPKEGGYKEYPQIPLQLGPDGHPGWNGINLFPVPL